MEEIKRRQKDKKTAEEKFEKLLDLFESKISYKISKINSNKVTLVISNVLSLVLHSTKAIFDDKSSMVPNKPNISKNEKLIKDAFKEYDDIKSKAIKKVNQDYDAIRDLHTKSRKKLKLESDIAKADYEMIQQVFSKKKRLSKNEKTQISNAKKKYEDLLSQYEDIKEIQLVSHNSRRSLIKDFKEADKIVNEIKAFIKSEKGMISGKESLTTDTYIQQNKKEKMAKTLKGGAALGASVLMGSGLPLVVPEMFKAGKEWMKDYKETSKLGKAQMIGGMALKGLGILSGSSGLLVAGSEIGQKANRELQMQRDRMKKIDNFKRNINNMEWYDSADKKRLDEGNSYVNELGKTVNRRNAMSTSGVLSRSRNRGSSDKEKLDDLIKILKSDKNLNRLLGDRFHKGGVVKGKGEVNAILNPAERILTEDQSNMFVDAMKTNKSLLDQMKTTNKILEEQRAIAEEAYEDQVEANSQSGLKRKTTDKTTKNDLIQNKKDEKEKKETPKSVGGIISNLKEKGISAAARATSKLLPGKLGKVAGSLIGSTSDALPVYVVNANEIGGGGFGDLFGKSSKSGKFGKGLEKVASKIPGGKLLKSIPKLGLKGIPLIGGAITGGLSYASTKAEGGSTAKAIGGASGGLTGGVLGGVMGSVFGPLGTTAGAAVGSIAGEWLGKKLGGLFENQNKTQEEFNKESKNLESARADENKSFFEKAESIWNDPSKSLLGKVGSTISAGWDTAKQSVGSMFKGKSSEFDISKLSSGVGAVAAQFESGGAGAGTISSGRGDFGGKSYGTHQFTGGALQDFIRSSSHAKEFEGLQKGSAAFDAAWKNAAKDPNFAKEQHDHIAKTHAAPQMAKLEKMGLDIKNRGIQEMAFSTGVQYGPGSNIIAEAIQASGKDPKSLSPKEIINIVQDYKAATVGQKFKSSSAAVQAGVARRHGKGEREALLAAAEMGDTSQTQTAQKASGVTSSPIATVVPNIPATSTPKSIARIPTAMTEGNVNNISKNAKANTGQSKGGKLKTAEVAIDTAITTSVGKGTEQAINNINIGKGTPPAPAPTPNIFTGDMISFATRLAKSY